MAGCRHRLGIETLFRDHLNRIGEPGNLAAQTKKEIDVKTAFLAIALMLMAGSAIAVDNPAPAPLAPLKGKVLEVKDVESYTYLRLQTKDGETWAAVARVPVKTGAEVTIDNPMVMNNFESKTLKKKFDRIVFGSIAGVGTAPAAAAALPMNAAHGAAGKPLDAGDVKVAKAAGADARTVAEIVTRRLDLKDKPVLVRGKVVKFNAGIMGKNWLHLRDGSGSATDGSDDILVTTQDEAKVGDVVLVRGTVRIDRDLGAGYSYKVLLEEGRFQK